MMGEGIKYHITGDEDLPRLMVEERIDAINKMRYEVKDSYSLSDQELLVKYYNDIKIKSNKCEGDEDE